MVMVQKLLCIFLFILVGNIPGGTSDDELRSILGEAGMVIGLRQVANDGKPYGFCEFVDEASATNAIKLFDGKQMKSKYICI